MISSHFQPNTSKKDKPLASISLDLDNLWTYLRIFGSPGWEDYPSYLNVLIPYALEIFENLGLQITFFVVGRDASIDENKDALKLLGTTDHEMGNHSFDHEPWLSLFSSEEVEREILKTEEQILQLSDKKVLGFRGPGFSWNNRIAKVLVENGYIYDATILPSYIISFLRSLYFRNPDLGAAEKENRKTVGGRRFGRVGPVKPYYWFIDGKDKLLEIPVTTVPIIKIPFHLSYLLYLEKLCSPLMSLYLGMAIRLCELTNTSPSFIIHPTDLLGGEQVPNMRFFPGMTLSAQEKLRVFKKVVGKLSRRFLLVRMITYAEAMLKKNDLKVRYI
jgi:hypothetical protein